jgi:hypothetical protein
MENKGTRRIPDDCDINKHNDQTDQEKLEDNKKTEQRKPKDSIKQESDETDQEKEATEVQRLVPRPFDKPGEQQGEGNRGKLQ